MADPSLVEYIRQHAAAFGAEALRKQLLGQGLPAAEVEAAMAEALPTMPPLVAVPSPPPPGAVPPAVPSRRRRAPRAAVAVSALAGGLGLMAVSFFMGRSPSAPAKKAAPPAAGEGALFHGSNDFILKLPPGYAATDTFGDAERTMEVVYVYPQGTDPQQFIDTGLYDYLGILRLEVMPRRVPQGFIGMDTLKAWVTHELEANKSTYESQTTVVNGLPALIVKTSKPFQSRKAYLVGEKERYTLTGGYENPVFDEVLQTLAETGGRATAED